MGRMKLGDKATALSAPRRSGLTPWQPGQSGNPAGRYLGSRQKLTEKFINDLSEFYEQEGAALIRRLADENPAALIQVVARLLPKESHIEISAGSSLDLTAEQRERIAESWLVSQTDDDAIEGVAVRIEQTKPKSIKYDDSTTTAARVKRAKTTDRVSRDTD